MWAPVCVVSARRCVAACAAYRGVCLRRAGRTPGCSACVGPSLCCLSPPLCCSLRSLQGCVSETGWPYAWLQRLCGPQVCVVSARRCVAACAAYRGVCLRRAGRTPGCSACVGPKSVLSQPAAVLQPAQPTGVCV